MSEPRWVTRLYQLTARNLRTRRRDPSNYLKQQELAKRTGRVVSRSSLANIEAGRQRITLHQLFALAGALGTEPTKLLPTLAELFETGAASLDRVRSKLSPEERIWVDAVFARTASDTQEMESSGADDQPDRTPNAAAPRRVRRR